MLKKTCINYWLILYDEITCYESKRCTRLAPMSHHFTIEMPTCKSKDFFLLKHLACGIHFWLIAFQSN